MKISDYGIFSIKSCYVPIRKKGEGEERRGEGKKYIKKRLKCPGSSFRVGIPRMGAGKESVIERSHIYNGLRAEEKCT